MNELAGAISDDEEGSRPDPPMFVRPDTSFSRARQDKG
jgi:hypothetical protein